MYQFETSVMVTIVTNLRISQTTFTCLRKEAWVWVLRSLLTIIQVSETWKWLYHFISFWSRLYYFTSFGNLQWLSSGLLDSNDTGVLNDLLCGSRVRKSPTRLGNLRFCSRITAPLNSLRNGFKDMKIQKNVLRNTTKQTNKDTILAYTYVKAKFFRCERRWVEQH